MMSKASSAVLLYNVYIKNNWKSVTQNLLKEIPHNDIYINVTIDWYSLPALPKALKFLKHMPKVKRVFVTVNRKKLGEVLGFIKLKENSGLENYEILTYMHSKGVTKPDNKNIKDWVELMRYFLIDRYDLMLEAFNRQFALYGVNLGQYDNKSERYGPYKFSNFHYSGNFVSVNLNILREQVITTDVESDYFGVEGFWGKITNIEKAYNAHNSAEFIKNHYQQPYPDHIYKTL